MYKKGSYIVLLSTCNGNPTNWTPAIPINHCYKLKEDSYEDTRGFMVELDMIGSFSNGWSCNIKFDYEFNKTRFRYATRLEREKYDRLNGPFKVDGRYDKLKKIYESRR